MLAVIRVRYNNKWKSRNVWRIATFIRGAAIDRHEYCKLQWQGYKMPVCTIRRYGRYDRRMENWLNEIADYYASHVDELSNTFTAKLY